MKKFYSSNAGISLLEILISVAISSVVVGQSYVLLSQNNKTNTDIAEKFNRHSILAQADILTKDKQDILISAKYNTQFKECKLKASKCPGTAPKYNAIPLSIYKKRGDKDIEVSGSLGKPVYYNRNGEIVSLQKASFSLESKVTAICEDSGCATDSPQSLMYEIILKNKIGSNWNEIKKVKTFEVLRSRKAVTIANNGCGMIGTRHILSTNVSQGGQLACDFKETPESISDPNRGGVNFRGDAGDAGDRGAPGPKGRTGRNGCSVYGSEGTLLWHKAYWGSHAAKCGK